MKYLIENRYSLQLKKLRKKKAQALEDDQTQQLLKTLKIGFEENKNSKKKITVDDVIDQINSNLEKKAKKSNTKKKLSSSDLMSAQSNIFMGEDMNAKIPFQDCIEVQFGEDGNIECFKLRKNLTKLAAEKSETEIVSLLRNFEYSISQLNQALFLKEKRDFVSKPTQTESPKPVLATFMKQLLADFESYDGGEAERAQIESELTHYSEMDLLNTEVTRITNNNNKLMTLKELMFSLFEYAKQKAISLSYHRKEMAENSPKAHKRDVSLSPRDDFDDSVLRRDDTSRSIVVDVRNLPPRYERSSSQDTSRVRFHNKDGKDKIIAEIPLIQMDKRPKMVDVGINRQESSMRNTIDLFSILRKHEEINEAGLLRNIENRAKYMIPIMVNMERNREVKSETKKRNPNEKRLSYLVDQGVSNRSINRQVKATSRKCDFGCQTVPGYGKDQTTMTVDATQSDELAKMIKVEAQKTIKMLEVFMNMNTSITDTSSDKLNMNEIHSKNQEDMKDAVERYLDTTADHMNDSYEDETPNVPEHDEDLFHGMNDKYLKGPYLTSLDEKQDRREPFSRYVEKALKRNTLDNSSLKKYIHPNKILDTEELLEQNTPKYSRNNGHQLRSNSKLLKKNTLKIEIHRTRQPEPTPGKFFKVRLRPLQRKKDSSKEIHNSFKLDTGPEMMVGNRYTSDKLLDYVSKEASTQLVKPAPIKSVTNKLLARIDNPNKSVINPIKIPEVTPKSIGNSKIFDSNILKKVNKSGIIYNHSIMDHRGRMYIETEDDDYTGESNPGYKQQAVGTTQNRLNETLDMINGELISRNGPMESVNKMIHSDLKHPKDVSHTQYWRYQDHQTL